MSNLVRMLHARVIVFSTNAKRAFKLKYEQLEVHLSLRGQFVS